MNGLGKICFNDDIDAWIKACAALVREGVTFEAYPQAKAIGGIEYIIELTGGY